MQQNLAKPGHDWRNASLHRIDSQIMSLFGWQASPESRTHEAGLCARLRSAATIAAAYFGNGTGESDSERR
jgi:hypothetical protein